MSVNQPLRSKADRSHQVNHTVSLCLSFLILPTMSLNSLPYLNIQPVERPGQTIRDQSGSHCNTSPVPLLFLFSLLSPCASPSLISHLGRLHPSPFLIPYLSPIAVLCLSPSVSLFISFCLTCLCLYSCLSPSLCVSFPGSVTPYFSPVLSTSPPS